MVRDGMIGNTMYRCRICNGTAHLYLEKGKLRLRCETPDCINIPGTVFVGTGIEYGRFIHKPLVQVI